MADKNLHDIKIDDIDSPKKTPLKNILTLLALLFIILVISVVITRLILNTDEGTSIDSTEAKKELLGDLKDANTTEIANDATADAKDSITDGVKALSTTTAPITERNLTSIIKAPLISHEPKKSTDEITSTYKAPKKNTTETTAPKKIVAQPQPKKVTIQDQPKKQYIEKVVTTKDAPKVSTVKNNTFLGGQQKAVSNSYYIKVGTYRSASTIVAKIKNNNFNYSLVKVENDKTLTRVLVGPFFSRNQAKTQLAKVKANILPGAYITKAK